MTHSKTTHTRQQQALHKTPLSERIKIVFIVLFGFSSLFGRELAFACSHPGNIRYETTVLSFEELRQALTSKAPRNIKKNGKIIAYKNFLLMSEPLEGVHIYDNANPRQPEAIAFIPIVGNSDISIKDDILYANNYVDIVIINLSDIDNIQFVGRVTNAFSPMYDNTKYDLSPDAGVITSVKTIYY